MLDFVLTYTDRLLLALTPQPPEFDIQLFLRPFTGDSWQGIAIILVCSLLCILIPGYILPYFESTASYQIAQLSLLYFFVLINAFYGGAMTMFFASEISIPFDTIRGAIQAYPDWKLMFQAGRIC